MRRPVGAQDFFVNNFLPERARPRAIKAPEAPAHDSVTVPSQPCSGQTQAMSGTPTTRTRLESGAPNRG